VNGGVVLVNPLPFALAHYERQLRCVLEAVDLVVTEGEGIAVESMDRRAGRLRTASRHIRSVRSLGRQGPPLVIWPALGLLDVWLWRWSRQRATVILHDPRPLTGERGHGHVARRLGGRAAAHHVQVIVHSEEAAKVVLELGWDAPTILPHPVLPPATFEFTRRLDGPVRVLGRYKVGRDLDAMAEMARRRPEQRFEVVGRGWPSVPGWVRDDRFVPEDELERLIATSTAVIVPYREFYASNVAVRALEVGTPVVAPTHTAIAKAWGVDWVGTVAADGWTAALDRATAVPTADITARHAMAWSVATGEWAQWAAARGER
jgi:hypothetical protein